jgi:NADPH-dependent 7-cyano-7-deazaguanine reductase QueF
MINLKICGMKAKALVSFIGLSTLVILLCSMASQAAEYREVNKEIDANNILKHIENGDDINLSNCSISGELDLSSIKLKTIPNQAVSKLKSILQL